MLVVHERSICWVPSPPIMVSAGSGVLAVKGFVVEDDQRCSVARLVAVLSAADRRSAVQSQGDRLHPVALLRALDQQSAVQPQSGRQCPAVRSNAKDRDLSSQVGCLLAVVS